MLYYIMLCYVMLCYVFWAFVDQFWAFVDQFWAFVDQFWATAAAARREQYFQAVQPQDTHMHRDEISRLGIKSLTLINLKICATKIALLANSLDRYCISEKNDSEHIRNQDSSTR